MYKYLLTFFYIDLFESIQKVYNYLNPCANDILLPFLIQLVENLVLNRIVV